MLRVISLALAFFSLLPAQAQRPYIRAFGQGTVSIRPDQVQASLGVTTQAATAQESSETNATRVAAVIDAVRQVLGQSADIRTVSYSVNPTYRYPPNGGTPTLTGYTTTNIVEVTTQNLNAIGRVIDAAVQAGATNIQSLRFGLKDPEPARRQALRLATEQARADAAAIASGLGASLGDVISVEESGAITVREALPGRTDTAVQTPIEPGDVDVRASVVIQVAIAGQ
jgi:uncharacterized protein YggE